MPKDKDFKRRVRERMRRTGERYTEALSRLRSQPAGEPRSRSFTTSVPLVRGGDLWSDEGLRETGAAFLEVEPGLTADQLRTLVIGKADATTLATLREPDRSLDDVVVVAAVLDVAGVARRLARGTAWADLAAAAHAHIGPLHSVFRERPPTNHRLTALKMELAVREVVRKVDAGEASEAERTALAAIRNRADNDLAALSDDALRAEVAEVEAAANGPGLEMQAVLAAVADQGPEAVRRAYEAHLDARSPGWRDQQRRMWDAVQATARLAGPPLYVVDTWQAPYISSGNGGRSVTLSDRDEDGAVTTHIGPTPETPATEGTPATLDGRPLTLHVGSPTAMSMEIPEEFRARRNNRAWAVVDDRWIEIEPAPTEPLRLRTVLDLAEVLHHRSAEDA